MLLTLRDLRKLVSKLNKIDKIKGAYKMKKEDLIKEIKLLKYDIDEENKRLIPKVEMKRRKIIKI